MNYKLAIFDFDGTLANTYPWLLSILSVLAQEHNVEPISPDQLEDMRSIGMRKTLNKYKFPLWKVPMVAKNIQEKMRADIHKISLYEGMEQILNNLFANGVQLAVVSSNERENIQNVLGKELSSLFSFYECGVSLFSKQTKFKKILKASGVSEKQALCIGDEIRDIQAARRANIPFGAVAWGYTNIDTLLSYTPQEVFHSVCEINCAFLAQEC
jgi:phosphoglycolate phosphatase